MDTKTEELDTKTEKFLSALEVCVDYLKSAQAVSAAPLILIVLQFKNIFDLGNSYATILAAGACVSFSVSGLVTLYFLLHAKIWLAREILYAVGEPEKGKKVMEYVDSRFSFFFRDGFLNEESFVTSAKLLNPIFLVACTLGYLLSLFLGGALVVEWWHSS